MRYVIRVTREPDGAGCDVLSHGETWVEAKANALRIAQANPHWFDPLPEHYYMVRREDDDEVAARHEDFIEIAKGGKLPTQGREGT